MFSESPEDFNYLPKNLIETLLDGNRDNDEALSIGVNEKDKYLVIPIRTNKKDIGYNIRPKNSRRFGLMYYGIKKITKSDVDSFRALFEKL